MKNKLLLPLLLIIAAPLSAMESNQNNNSEKVSDSKSADFDAITTYIRQSQNANADSHITNFQSILLSQPTSNKAKSVQAFLQQQKSTNNISDQKSEVTPKLTGTIKDVKAVHSDVIEKEILSLLIDWNANTVKDMFIPIKEFIKNMLLIKKKKSKDFNLENELKNNPLIKNAKELMQAVHIANQVVNLVPGCDDIINSKQPAATFSEKFPQLWKNEQFMNKLKNYVKQKGYRNFTVSYRRPLSEKQRTYLLQNKISWSEDSTDMDILSQEEGSLSEKDKEYKQFFLAQFTQPVTTQPSNFLVLSPLNHNSNPAPSLQNLNHNTHPNTDSKNGKDEDNDLYS